MIIYRMSRNLRSALTYGSNPAKGSNEEIDNQIRIYNEKMNKSEDAEEIKWYQNEIAKLTTELNKTLYNSQVPTPPPTSKDGSNSPQRQGRTYKLPNGGKRRTKRKSRKTKKRKPRKTYKP